MIFEDEFILFYAKKVLFFLEILGVAIILGVVAGGIAISIFKYWMKK